jgi:hypothetical protein
MAQWTVFRTADNSPIAINLDRVDVLEPAGEGLTKLGAFDDGYTVVVKYAFAELVHNLRGVQLFTAPTDRFRT